MAYRRYPDATWRHPRVIAACLLALAAMALLAAHGGASSAPPPRHGARVAASNTLVINEIDYDQPGTDNAEFIELHNVSGSAVDLDPYAVELVNGDLGGATVYRTIDLPSHSLPAGGYYVICGNAGNVPNCDLQVGIASNLIQNGAPDAVAVVDGASVIDTVSYEGDTGSPYTEGSGSGLVDDGSGAGEGISRYPDGTDSDQNNQDLSVRCVTPGEANTQQDSGCESATATPEATVTPNATATLEASATPDATGTPDAGATPDATATPDITPPTPTQVPPTATEAAAGATPTEDPLAVELDMLSAVRRGHIVNVSWSTQAEMDNAGFHVWRAEGARAPQRLTRALIPARGSTMSGAWYVFRDTGAPPAGARYWVQDVDRHAQATWHGPVAVGPWQPRWPSAVPYSRLPDRAARVPGW